MPGPNCAGAHHPLKVLEVDPSMSEAQQRAARMLEGPARYCCLAGGTRSGKTFLIVRSIVARAILAPGSRHAILRFHANAAKASIAHDTLPHVKDLCFPGVELKEHKVDGYFSLKNGAQTLRRDADGAVIPADPANIDWQAYQAWLEAGNTPTESTQAPPLDVPPKA